MSKKLLSVVVAVSVIGSFMSACYNNDSCIDYTMNCEDNVSQICLNGSWEVGGNACSAESCTTGQTLCVGGSSLVCTNGEWEKGGDACGTQDESCTVGQTACDGTSVKTCTAAGWVSQDCPTGTTCSVVSGVAACIPSGGGTGTCTLGQTACDGTSVKVCVSSAWVSTVCPLGCSVNDGIAACNTSTTCTNGATQCVNNVSQICSNGSWVSGGSACGGGSTPTTDEPVAGASCDETTYEGGCSSDLTKRYYCESGVLVEKSCNSGTSCVVKGNNSSTCESTDVADCAPGGTVYCNKVCKADGSEGYYKLSP